MAHQRILSKAIIYAHCLIIKLTSIFRVSASNKNAGLIPAECTKARLPRRVHPAPRRVLLKCAPGPARGLPGAPEMSTRPGPGRPGLMRKTPGLGPGPALFQPLATAAGIGLGTTSRRRKPTVETCVENTAKLRPQASVLAPRPCTFNAQRSAPRATACKPRSSGFEAHRASAWAPRSSTCDAQRAASRETAWAQR